MDSVLLRYKRIGIFVFLQQSNETNRGLQSVHKHNREFERGPHGSPRTEMCRDGNQHSFANEQEVDGKGRSLAKTAIHSCTPLYSATTNWEKMSRVFQRVATVHQRSAHLVRLLLERSLRARVFAASVGRFPLTVFVVMLGRSSSKTESSEILPSGVTEAKERLLLARR